jgi:hypothetical protein
MWELESFRDNLTASNNLDNTSANDSIFKAVLNLKLLSQTSSSSPINKLDTLYLRRTNRLAFPWLSNKCGQNADCFDKVCEYTVLYRAQAELIYSPLRGE